MSKQKRFNQHCQQPRCTNSSGIMHISSPFLAKPEFLVSNAVDIVDFEDFNWENAGLLPSSNQSMRLKHK